MITVKEKRIIRIELRKVAIEMSEYVPLPELKRLVVSTYKKLRLRFSK